MLASRHRSPLVTTVLFFVGLVALLTFAPGCAEEQELEARRRVESKTAASASALLANSCSVTRADVDAAAASIDSAAIETTPLMRATTQLAMLREATKKVDAKLQSHLARIAPALEDDKVQKLATVFEDQAKVVVKIYRDDDYFDDVDLPVKEIRSRHFDAVKKLAAMLDAIDASSDRARSFATQQELREAYVELSQSPCPARAVRFAAILLSLGGDASSPYARMSGGDSRSYAVLMLQQGLANAFVERAVENTPSSTSTATKDAPNKALADLRTLITTSTGVTDNVMSFLQNRETARAKALDPSFEAKVEGHDLAPVLRTINGVMLWWNVSQEAAAGDVQSLLVQSPAIAESVAKGVGALAEHFEATRIAGAATKVATAAAFVGRIVGFVFATKSIIDTLDRLDDPRADTKQLVVSLVGQCMILAGSFMPPPLSFAVVGIGQIAVWISTLIGDPPPDELAPLLDQLAKDGVLRDDEKVAITEAHPSNIAALGRSMHMKPADVRWTLTTSRLTAKTNLGKVEGLFGDESMGIFRIHQETGLDGDAMAAYLRGIATSSGAEGRLELTELLIYTAAPGLFQGVNVKQAITNRRDALDEYDVKYDAADVNISASRALTLVRGAFDRAIEGLP